MSDKAHRLINANILKYIISCMQRKEKKMKAQNRKEIFLKAIANGEEPKIEPLTRKEILLKKQAERESQSENSSGGGLKLIFEGDIDFDTENNDGTTCYKASEAVNIPLEFGKVYLVKYGIPSDSEAVPYWYACITVGTNNGYSSPGIGASEYISLDGKDKSKAFHFSRNEAYYYTNGKEHFKIYELC